MIVPVQAKHASEIAGIYNYYIEHTVVTFEEFLVTADDMSIRIEEVNQKGLPWYVGLEGDKVVGYAYASPWNTRCSYRKSCEVTVYLSKDHCSQGWGTKLYAKLFEQLKAIEMHAVMAGITMPNPASVVLHEKFGMKKVAHFADVGNKFDDWLDVAYWQIVL